MEFVGGYPQKEKANADFQQRSCKHIKDFTKEPELGEWLAKGGSCGLNVHSYGERFFSSCWFKVGEVLSCTIDESSKLASQVRRVEKLRSEHSPVIGAERLDHACSDPYPQTDGNP